MLSYFRFKKDCLAFFVEMVSSLCFGQPVPPEPQLIQLLLNIVFDEENSILRQFQNEESGGTIMHIGSFLLQLLLEYK